MSKDFFPPCLALICHKKPQQETIIFLLLGITSRAVLCLWLISTFFSSHVVPKRYKKTFWLGWVRTRPARLTSQSSVHYSETFRVSRQTMNFLEALNRFGTHFVLSANLFILLPIRFSTTCRLVDWVQIHTNFFKVAIALVDLLFLSSCFSCQIPYAPYLARQFSKLYRHLHFQARKLKFGPNIDAWLTNKCINFQHITFNTNVAHHFVVRVPKKSCAQQYNRKIIIFSSWTTSNHCWANRFDI